MITLSKLYNPKEDVSKHKAQDKDKTKVCDGRNDCMVCKEVFQVHTHLDVVFVVMWMFPSSPHNKP